MSKTKGYVVTTSEGADETCGAVFVPTLDEALEWADTFAADGHVGYVMRVKGVYAYEPHETEIVTTKIEASASDDWDDWSDLL